MSNRTATSLARAYRATSRRVPGRRMAICNYCLNRNTYECEFECQPEGKYRYLEPEPLPQWEAPPQLPPYREVADMPLEDALAIIWLHAYYRDPE